MHPASSCAWLASLVTAAALLSQSALADDAKPAPPDPAPAAAAAPPAAAPPAAAPPAAPAAAPPAAAPAPAADAPKRDIGLVIGGVLMIAFGTPSLVAGSVLAATCHSATMTGCPKTDATVALTLGGAALLAGGLVTTIAGARSPSDKSAARFAPSVALGPTGGSLRWTF